ncbi:hypothetical protein HDZ31DRAFT_75120 [Schizophyllum fasciatum]
MPLPENQQISVKPNNAEVKHKHAITLRMSEDLIEALMANPSNLAFEFNTANQGIYVNDQCFGLSLSKEQSPHELFMQMPLHRDKALKHYADISHRFTVSAGSLDEAAKKLRVATDEANKQRQERKVVMLDEAPSSSTTAPKKTKPAARKQIASSSAAPSRSQGTQPAQPPPPPSRPLSAISPDLRYRVVHCLASSGRTADELVKRVCGGAADERKKADVRAIMQDVADGKDGLWRLSTKGWLEVQPYKWPNWSESDRQQALRKATAAFRTFKVPEGDPRWDNLAQPKPPPAPTLAPVPTPAPASRHPLPAKPPAPEAPKRSTTTKDKKPRAKPETKEIMMKDERRLTPASTPAGPSKSKELPTQSTPLPAEPPRPARVEALAATRRPGSGYKAPKSLTPPARTSSAADKRGGSEELTSASASMRASIPKGKSAARPSADPSRPSPAHHASTPQPRERDRTSSSAQPARPHNDTKERTTQASGSDRHKEAPPKKRPVEEARRHAMKREEEESPPKKSTTKRKVPVREDSYDSSSDDDRQRVKRRKVVDGASRASAPAKKADHVKVKRSDSPPPARSRNPERDALAGLGRIPKSKDRVSDKPSAPPRQASEQSSNSSSSHKRRRVSPPHYTSSEEDGEAESEGEIDPRPAKKKVVAKEHAARPASKPRKGRPLNAGTVEEEYQAKFLEYLPVALADRKQRMLVERLLDAGSDDSVDDDGLLSDGESRALHANHLRLRGELLDLEKQYIKLAPSVA